jgi:AcrR family transcriptional regulator
VVEDVGDLGTRERILAVAWKIIEDKGEAAATIKAVAKLAQLSRQAVYLHFKDRSELLSSLSDYVDEKIGLSGWMAAVEALEDGEAMLWRIAETRIKRSKTIAALVRSVEADRYRDEAAAAAWTRRHEMNVTWMEKTVVRRLSEEGRVHKSWIAKDAATLLVNLFSFRAWDDLTHASGWSAERYMEITTCAALSVLAGSCRSAAKPIRGMRRAVRGGALSR